MAQTIYLVEMRTSCTEWDPICSFTTLAFAEHYIELQKASDQETGIKTRFEYHVVHIKLFDTLLYR